jgi:hypothetical protein
MVPGKVNPLGECLHISARLENLWIAAAILAPPTTREFQEGATDLHG